MPKEQTPAPFFPNLSHAAECASDWRI